MRSLRRREVAQHCNACSLLRAVLFSPSLSFPAMLPTQARTPSLFTQRAVARAWL